MKVKGNDPLHKVTIVPRGRALGLAFTLPEDDRVSVTREQLEARLVMAYGGRVAEELVFGRDRVTTGAASDIQQATGIARRYVTQWGLSDAIGPILVGDNEQELFLGREHPAAAARCREQTAQLVDARGEARDRRGVRPREGGADARTSTCCTTVAAALLERETLTREDIEVLAARRDAAAAGADRVRPTPAPVATPRPGRAAAPPRRRRCSAARRSRRRERRLIPPPYDVRAPRPALPPLHHGGRAGRGASCVRRAAP